MTKDTRIEHWLNISGVEYEYLGSVDLAEIDERRSLLNRGRFVAYDHDHVEEMAILYLDGMHFPPAIAYRGPEGYVYLDGVHRHFMRKAANDKCTDLYVVKTSDAYVIDYLTRQANVLNGRGISDDEKMESAKYIVRTYGQPISDIAKMFGIKGDRLQVALRTDKVRAELRTHGIDLTKFPGTAPGRLHALANLPVRLEMARLIVNYKLTSQEWESMIIETRQRPSEAAQLAYLDAITKRPEMKERLSKTRGGHAGKWTGRAFLINRIEQASMKLRTSSLAQLQVTSDGDIERVAEAYANFRRLMDARLEEARRQRSGNPAADNGRPATAQPIGSH